MPELPVKEIRLSELRLPEINRTDIMRSLSEIKMPEVDLPKVDRPKFEMPDIDLGKAVAGAAVAAGIRRRSRRRWPFAVGALVVAGLATAIVTNESLRNRVAGAIDALRDRLWGMRDSRYDALDIDRDDTFAFDAAETAPIETSPLTDPSSSGTADYPTGLGSNGQDDGIPAFEESSTATLG